MLWGAGWGYDLYIMWQLNQKWKGSKSEIRSEKTPVTFEWPHMWCRALVLSWRFLSKLWMSSRWPRNKWSSIGMQKRRNASTNKRPNYNTQTTTCLPVSVSRALYAGIYIAHLRNLTKALKHGYLLDLKVWLKFGLQTQSANNGSQLLLPNDCFKNSVSLATLSV